MPVKYDTRWKKLLHLYIVFSLKKYNNLIYNFCILACADHCEICSQNSSTNDCEICIENYYKSQDSQNNRTICTSCNNTGQYISNEFCLNCSNFCKTCLNEQECLECYNDYLYIVSQKTCAASCPIGFYENNTYCNDCDEKCSQCFGPLETQCTKCNSLYFQYGNHCLSSCPLNMTNNSQGICESLIYFLIFY